jgi:phosphoribosylformylglycinamidine synthase
VFSRVLRACIELADKNPIISIHDQGAGGNGNVLKEIVEPLGAVYDLRKIPCGDPTLSALELWGAEYQENDGFLTTKEDLPMVLQFAKRENCPIAAVGEVSAGAGVPVSVPGSMACYSAAVQGHQTGCCIHSLSYV